MLEEFDSDPKLLRLLCATVQGGGVGWYTEFEVGASLMPVMANAGVKPECWVCSGLCGAGFVQQCGREALLFPVA